MSRLRARPFHQPDVHRPAGAAARACSPFCASRTTPVSRSCTDQGTVYLCKARDPDLETLAGPFPIQLDHELYRLPAGAGRARTAHALGSLGRPVALGELHQRARSRPTRGTRSPHRVSPPRCCSSTAMPPASTAPNGSPCIRSNAHSSPACSPRQSSTPPAFLRSVMTSMPPRPPSWTRPRSERDHTDPDPRPAIVSPASLRLTVPVNVERLISLKEAADRFPLSYSQLRRLARTGRLAATKLGRDWFTTPEDVAALPCQRQPAEPRPAQVQTRLLVRLLVITVRASADGGERVVQGRGRSAMRGTGSGG